MMINTRDRLYGFPVIITNRVKPGALYKFEGYVLVHPSNHQGFIDWMNLSAQVV